MKLNKLFFVGLASFALMAAGCVKHEVTTDGASTRGASTHVSSTHSAATHSVKSLASKPASSSVYFAFDSAALDAAGSATLDGYAAWLNDHGAVSVTIEGNCDQRGSREYNLALGQERADSVKAYLAARGVSASHIDTVSFGEERPVCSGTGEACWAQNRHADIVSR
ncbi:MAG: peptidoglycan-associated lipoprotein Pal [Mariprofundaceae bacterium]|nr:peptidoglycan-associated lipoprotein Pal [Mariprofundaceae bacterium]